MTVMGINDNAPQFMSRIYTAIIPEDLNTNTTILHFLAIDDDSNSRVIYLPSNINSESLQQLAVGVTVDYPCFLVII